MRKLILFVALAIVAGIAWVRSGRSANGLIDLTVNNAPLAEVIDVLRRKSGEQIAASKKLDARITLSVRQQTLEAILARVAEQANAVSILALPIYSDDASFQELANWFESAAPVKRWTELTNLFSGERQMMFFRDPREPEPLLTLSVTNVPAADAAALISRGAGAHVLVEDKQSARVSLKLKDEPVLRAAATLSTSLGKKATALYALQPRPKQLALIGAGEKEVRETSGNTERVIRHQAGPGDRERMEKLISMTPDERKAFLREDFSNKAAARMKDRLRNQTPEQRVDQLRNRGRQEEIEER